jgi:hypothetical protein
LLLKRTETNAETLAKESKPTALASYLYLDNILANNNLIPCWAEFASIKEVIKPEKGDTIKMLEKAGKVQITLKFGKFFLIVDFVVPSSYPMQKVQMNFREHNFNEVFTEVFKNHAEQVIRRLWQGVEPGYDSKVDTNEGKIGYKKSLGAKEADMARIAVASRSELKHDMDFLKK